MVAVLVNVGVQWKFLTNELRKVMCNTVQALLSHMTSMTGT